MSIKGSVEVYVEIHKYREESYIVPEELVSYLQSLYLVLLFSLILQQSFDLSYSIKYPKLPF
jgi:hypothetical protein